MGLVFGLEDAEEARARTAERFRQIAGAIAERRRAENLRANMALFRRVEQRLQPPAFAPTGEPPAQPPLERQWLAYAQQRFGRPFRLLNPAEQAVVKAQVARGPYIGEEVSGPAFEQRAGPPLPPLTSEEFAAQGVQQPPLDVTVPRTQITVRPDEPVFARLPSLGELAEPFLGHAAREV